MFKEPRGVLIDNTQQPWARGVTGKDGQSAGKKRARVLVTARPMRATCSCAVYLCNVFFRKEL